MIAGRLFVLAVALLLAGGGCGGDEGRVTGVVVDLEGDLMAVSSFTIVDSDGGRLTFRPGPDLVTFDHGAPLAHLTEHLRTGEPIRVTYSSADDGFLIALIVEDDG